jgi:hypothetical protein
LAVALGGLLGLLPGDDAQARCKRPCGHCRRCKKGKRKPNSKANAKPCGPCSECHDGRCRALCARDFCVDGVCNPLCDPPCGPCNDCRQGACQARCPIDRCEVGIDVCLVSCDPECLSTQECIQGACYDLCNPACPSDQGCVDGECRDLSGGCATQDWCVASQKLTSCPAVGPGTGCVQTAAGDPFCALSVDCLANGSDLCQADEDCRLYLEQPNARCVPGCDVCNGGSACISFYLDN